MKRQIKFLFFYINIMLFSICGNAQLEIEKLGNMDFTTFKSIEEFKIFNSSMIEQRFVLTISIKASNGDNVVDITYPEVKILPNNSINRFSEITGKRILMYNTFSGKFLKSNDKLMDGLYSICYTVFNAKIAASSISKCYNFEIRNNSEISLLSPFNGDNICAEYPSFSWTPLLNYTKEFEYEFRLVEILEGQNETEAILRNMPIVAVRNLQNTNFLLPSYIQRLEEGKKYAWQVLVYNKMNEIVQKSQIWIFTEKCNRNKDSKETIVDNYVHLKSELEGNYYLVKTAIKFSFINTYQTQKLAYCIEDLTTGRAIKYFPEISIKLGLNNIVLDINDCSGLKKGNYYVLKVFNVNTSTLQMRFIYEN